MLTRDEIISLLESKIRQFVEIAEHYRSDNELLRQQNAELLVALQEKSQKVEVLESKYESLSFTKKMISSWEGVKDVKLQINRMVHEIDKCIALLNR